MLPDEKEIYKLEDNENHDCLGIMEAGDIRQKKQYIHKLTKALKSKLITGSLYWI